MGSRAYWKGYLRLSLVSCPIALSTRYVEVEPDELEAIALKSNRMIEIDEFLPRKEIDELYFANPYYIVPDGGSSDDRTIILSMSRIKGY
jgi:non-homologous end joining protein Ku